MNKVQELAKEIAKELGFDPGNVTEITLTGKSATIVYMGTEAAVVAHGNKGFKDFDARVVTVKWDLEGKYELVSDRMSN